MADKTNNRNTIIQFLTFLGFLAGMATCLVLFAASVFWLFVPSETPQVLQQFYAWWHANMPAPPSIETSLFIAWASVVWVLFDLRNELQQIREQLNVIQERIN